jgi:hypothetical protein
MELELAILLKEINNNYTNYDIRYTLILEALLEAKKLNYECGFRLDVTEANWPVVVIVLPEIGQVSWHMPPSGIIYDNSTPEDCQKRCSLFFEKHGNMEE